MTLPDNPNSEHFPPVLSLIQQAKACALSTVNQQLLELYWQIGEYLSLKVVEQGWGQGTVKELAQWLAEREPNLRGFYLKLAIEQRWSSRELEQQINNALFERTIASPLKVSALLREIHPAANQVFKDSYLFDFLHNCNIMFYIIYLLT